MNKSRASAAYRLLKVQVDLGHGGCEGQFFAYVLYDERGIRLCHGRCTEPGASSCLHGGIKAAWRDFSVFVDEDAVVGGKQPEPSESGASQDDQSDADIFYLTMQELRRLLDDAGLYDLSGGNFTKLRYIEKIFLKASAMLHSGDRFAFIKIDSLSDLEADEIMSSYPEERAANEPWRVRSNETVEAEERELPKAVFSCSVLLDPVKGLPASELKPGDRVWLDIPQESLLFSIAKFRQGESFQGILEGEVVSSEPSETDRLLLLFSLSDEFRAVAVVKKNLKVKMGARDERKQRFSLPKLPVEMQFIVFGVVFFVLVLLVFFLM